MSFLSNLVKNVKEFYSEINGSTLTGSIDVIVVEQEDGTLKSSPFHVRFGKMGVLKAKEKIIDIEINGEPVEIQMKLDDTGTAFFVEEVDEEDDCWQDNLQTSPIPGHPGPQDRDGENPCLDRPATQSDHKQFEDVFIKAQDEEGHKGKVKSGQIEHLENYTDEMFDMDDISEVEVVSEDWLENNKLYKGNANHAFNKGNYSPNKDHSLENLFIEQKKTRTEKVLHESFQPKSVCSGFHYFPSQQPSSFGQQLKQSEDKNVWRWGELPNSDPLIDDEKNMPYTKSEKKDPKEQSLPGSLSRNQTKHTVNLNLEDIENKQDILGEFLANNHNEQQMRGIERIDSGCEEDADSSTNSDISKLLSKHIPDLAASLCGGLSEGNISAEKFQLKILDFTEFLSRITSGSLLSETSLVFRVNGKYLSWEKAAPILFSVIFFQKSLPSEVVREITKVPENMVVVPALKGTSVSTSTTPTGSTTCFRKSLRLSSEKLSELRLKSGKNEMELSVTTALQGTTRCRCNIYLWHHQDKIVISDIDGTITKSDVLGHILPVIGQNWAQSGVADLFSKIKSNGYHIMYLTARALGQASTTKGYLQTLKQGDVCLPDGPLFLNPDSLVHAIKREVIDRNPEEFKIRCLKDIQSLFADKNPFFAGYGNRPNDAFAYRALGIPVSRIFTINPAGELKHELTQHFQTSYEAQSVQVDYYFPNLVTVQQIKNQLKAFPRKQSIYFDAFEYAAFDEKLEETNENISDNEDQTHPFRVRSGTDISDSVNAARYKLKMKRKSLKPKPEPGMIDLLKEEGKSLITEYPSQVCLEHSEASNF